MAETESILKGKHILAVDDEEDILETVFTGKVAGRDQLKGHAGDIGKCGGIRYHGLNLLLSDCKWLEIKNPGTEDLALTSPQMGGFYLY